MCVGIYLSMHVCWCMCILVNIYMWVYTSVYACILWSVYVYESMFVLIHVFSCMLQRFGSVWWDPNLIRIRAHCGPDTMAIRRLAHEMIRKSVPVRAVKTRQRFGSETASFHVSVRSCTFPYLPLPVCIYMLHLLFHVAFCYMLSVWLLVLLHKTPMIAHFNYVVDMSMY